MRIAVDVRPLLARQISGIPEYTGRLIEALIKAHPEVEWVLFYSSWKKKPNNWLHLTDRPNVSWQQLKMPNKLINTFASLFNRPFIDKQIQADVWLLPHFNFTPLSGRTPTILTIHDLSFLRQPEFFSWRQRLWHFSLKLNRLVGRVDKIVAISESTKRDLRELLGVPEDKIDVIYSAVDEQFKPLNKTELLPVKDKYKLPERFILSLATFEPRKNLATVIEGFDSLLNRRPDLKDCQLVIAGGQGWRHGRAKAVWKKVTNQKNIKWLGYLPAADLPAVYNLASALVYPSFYEGFGLPVLEAMASGVPVITSSVTALPEVADRAALMIDPADSQAISRAMEQLLSDEILRKELSLAGQKIASKFSWQKTAEAYWQLLQR
ncbi:MAG TPA: glycosyltransferase family 1 protein [bacterium]|nr:glycosyltransferase family 1 protein [bacterium]